MKVPAFILCGMLHADFEEEGYMTLANHRGLKINVQAKI